jgi:NADPH-dependent curcumin reductase CurA
MSSAPHPVFEQLNAKYAVIFYRNHRRPVTLERHRLIEIRRRQMKKTLFTAAAVALSAAAFAPLAHAGDDSAKTTGVVAGAATGAVVAGPVGAVVGGAMGLTTGAVIDDASKPKKETVIIRKQPDVVIQDEPSDVIVDQ